MKTLAVKNFFCTNILYCYYYYGIFFSLPQTHLFVINYWSCYILLDTSLFLFLRV